MLINIQYSSYNNCLIWLEYCCIKQLIKPKEVNWRKYNSRETTNDDIPKTECYWGYMLWKFPHSSSILPWTHSQKINCYVWILACIFKLILIRMNICCCNIPMVFLNRHTVWNTRENNNLYFLQQVENFNFNNSTSSVNWFSKYLISSTSDIFSMVNDFSATNLVKDTSSCWKTLEEIPKYVSTTKFIGTNWIREGFHDQSCAK